jgi:hypothetical protein
LRPPIKYEPPELLQTPRSETSPSRYLRKTPLLHELRPPGV